jgi:ATP-dependent DNA helicase RecG
MEDIPNKAVNHLGLVVDVNLHNEASKYYIEIIVPINSVPIAYHGVYHYRSGSTKQELRKDHSSYPRNRNIANVFFKAGYIESWGRGTNKIIDSCIEAGLPEPLIEEEQGGFSITFLKDIYTEKLLKGYGLEVRHIKALLFIKANERITNKQYQDLFNVSKRTVSYDLQLLLEKNLILKIGSTGKGTYYILQRGNKGAIGATKGQ